MQKGNAKIKPGRYLINRAEVARKLGVSSRYISMLFRGERKNRKRLMQIKKLIREELTTLTRCIGPPNANLLGKQTPGPHPMGDSSIQNKKEGESK